MTDSMEHLEEGLLQALLDGEMTGSEALAAGEHLAGCRRCTDALEAQRALGAELADALAVLDLANPKARRAVVPPPSMLRPRWRWGRAAVPKAALLVLGFVAVASAALPGSPLRDWFEALRESPAAAPIAAGGPDAGPELAESATAALAPESGVSVEPHEGRIRILLTRPAPELVVRASVTDSRRGGAFGSGEAAAARFSTSAGVVEVIDAPGGELRVELPRSAVDAAILVDGRPFVVKSGDQLRLTVPDSTEPGPEIRFRVPR